MARLNRPPVIYSPTNLQDLLKIYNLNKDAVIYAGGTGRYSREEGDLFNMRGSVINISGVEELKKISRTDRFLELGATVTVSRILELGKTIVPESIYAALKQMGPPHIRNMATLGGNLFRQGRTMDLLPVLHLHDAQAELRKFRDIRSPRRLLRGDSRWIPAARLFGSDGTPDIAPGEILTRIRIPGDSWNFQTYRKIEGFPSPLIFTALANRDKFIITEFRLCFGTDREKILRNRDFEAEMIGRRIPLTRREIGGLGEKLGAWFQTVGLDGFTIARSLALTAQFLEKISEPVEEGTIFN